MEYSKIAPMMSELWSPIAAVTSQQGGQPNVQIAVAIAAASIVPDSPRVVVQIYKTNKSHDMIWETSAFALNFLRTDQLGLIKDFGLVSGRDRDKLAVIPHAPGLSGSPLLGDCWGYMDCRVVNAMDGGDMTCFLADVLDGGTLGKAGDEAGPLWWRDARRRMPQEWMREWERKQAGEVAYSRDHMGEIELTPWRAPETA